MSSRDALIIALPAGGGDRDHAPWWRVIDGQVTQSGTDLGWLHPSADGPLAAETHVLGIAPAGDVALHRASFPGLTAKQTEAAAKLLVAEQSLTAATDLHVAIGAADSDGTRDIAAIDAGTMARWLVFAQAHGLDMVAIVPAGLVIAPSSDPDVLVRARIGDELLLRGSDSAFIADPVLVEHIAGSETRIVDAAAETVEAGLIAASDSPAVDLRSGRFARKPAGWLDKNLAKRAALLVAAILIVSLLIAVTRIGRLHAEIATIDEIGRAHV